MEKLLTISEAAEILNVHPRTLRQNELDGLLNCVRLPAKHGPGHRRFRMSDIEQLLTAGQTENKEPPH